MDLISTNLIGAVADSLARAAPAIPPGLWPVTFVILLLLAAAALIDIRTTRVPDPIIFIGLVLVTATQGFFASWPDAGTHLRYAVAAGLLIWIINEIWFRLFNRDALGMGDAKWTMLAVACFGIMPSVIAWGTGAILGVLFIAAAKIARRPTSRVTFAPFLMLGLCVGIYWVRFK